MSDPNFNVNIKIKLKMSISAEDFEIFHNFYMQIFDIDVYKKYHRHMWE